MKRSRQSIALALAAATLAGCATGPKVNLPAVALGNDRVQIIWLHSYRDKGGVRVLGHVQRAPQSYGTIDGHLHVVAYFTDGTPPVAVDTHWGPLPVQGNRKAPFSALLPASHPDSIERISVEYRPASKDG